MDKKAAAQYVAGLLADTFHAWRPTSSHDASSQKRILQLETELAQAQAQLQGQDPGNQEPRGASSCRVNLNINGDGFTSILVCP
jgi:hypothetical protein